MQDDPLSEFSGSVPLCADGGGKKFSHSRSQIAGREISSTGSEPTNVS